MFMPHDFEHITCYGRRNGLMSGGSINGVNSALCRDKHA